MRIASSLLSEDMVSGRTGGSFLAERWKLGRYRFVALNEMDKRLAHQDETL